jgi:hypothetical protein
MNYSHAENNSAIDRAHSKFNKKELKRLTTQLTDSQFIRELDKLKIPRSLKKELYQIRMAKVQS